MPFRAPLRAKTVVLSGGVGGARFTWGLARFLPPEALTVVVNVGDDFRHFGLYISPDLDTVCYTLANMEHPERGWGLAEETWHALEMVARLGGPTWFRLGDRDLGLHLERTRRLAQGQPLSRVVQDVCRTLGVKLRILPVTDDPLRTVVLTREHGPLPFQEYFVKHGTQPTVTGFHFQGAAAARPAPGVLDALHQADMVLLAPSNPWVSLDPILAVPGLREALRSATVVGVSPILGGKTVKGPAAKMYRELGIEPSALAVARHYRGLLSGFVVDNQDAALAPLIEAELGIPVLITDTWMQPKPKREQVARSVWEFAYTLHFHMRKEPHPREGKAP